MSASSSRKPDEIVFCDPSRKGAQSNPTLKAQKKAFMSSRIAKVTTDIVADAAQAAADEKNDDEFTHAQNDAILHRLLHTKLLSGSLNPELNLTHAQREKALAGRVLELSGHASLGAGEKATRKREHNNAAKHVRDGLQRKKKEREKQDLEEAKNLGNYHPSLKKVLDPDSKPSRAKRERGLKMGVGRFSGGILKISKKDLGAIRGG
ncbi:hypothetical protein SERLA73DRAFT_104789 [Serpula lacrymans var. lacrymans S7.3]|uniref:Uncharacterized protein n=2 Tax=Serpula lacrymans var. lacrymans TaxID=341189 RepID=F8PR87_SERL3|nr:uncharacterized protein SERLADRAFT_462612 [Serpula lacrymans var. lacrymans S7.9]EGO02378.1 hypothetical protein SERLA73DRAFT_104789 [Serpula lacrymans var. lacrymans S7.3]EGO28105.1 hypothetical protein SERLADRAFT_462612 [Serpula lacrymans var. lacrymans S7.9]